MIGLVTGVLGAGKTYFIINEIYKNIKEKKSEIYTNISLNIAYNEQIHFLAIAFLRKISGKELELNRFHSKQIKLCNLYNEYIENDKVLSCRQKRILKEEFNFNEDELKEANFVLKDPQKEQYIKHSLATYVKDDFNVYVIDDYKNDYDLYAKASGIMSKYENSIICWDECHIALENKQEGQTSKPIDEFIRLFSYSRHFNIDIYLITQNLSLIHRNYKAMIEVYYYAKSSKKRFFSNVFRYEVYSNYKMYKNDLIETINLKLDKKVAALYNSGSNKIGNTVVLQRFIPIFVVILIVFFMYEYFFISSNVDDSVQLHPVEYVSNNRFYPASKKSEILVNRVILFFRCNLDLCTLENSSFSIPMHAMDKIDKILDLKILYKMSINRYYTRVAISVSKDLYKDISRYSIKELKGKQKNEKSHINNSSVPKFL